MARGGGGVEEELWNIFTFYTLRGNPFELTRLSVTQFLRLARDCAIIDGVPTELSGGITIKGQRGQRNAKSKSSLVLEKKKKKKRPLGPAVVNLAFASVLQRRFRALSEPLTASRPSCRDDRLSASARGEQVEPSAVSRANHLLNYPEFLDALAILGERMYSPGHTRGSAHVLETTFKQLLMENILPLASRRRPVALEAELRDPLVRDILRHYEPALREIFRFYAASSSDGDTEREKPRVQARSEALDLDTTAAATPPSVSLTPSAHPHEPSSVTPAEGVPTADDVPVKKSLGLTEGTMPLAATTSADCGPGHHDAPATVSSTTAAVTAAVVTESDCGHHKGIGVPIDSGSGGVCRGKGASRRRRKGRVEKNMPSLVMNSMADALSHRSLLCFTADFGISGALVSGLEVGDIFLSCGGGGLFESIDDYVDDDARSSSQEFPRVAWRTSLAREGRGDVRPLVFTEFLEALVRIAVACFRPRCAAAAGTMNAGHCLRALLTYVWRGLHASVELALNGVRAGERRHYSSIQKGALLRGVQLFNGRMLSRWRTEGFIDFAADAACGAVSAVPASEILRKLLALEGEEPTLVLRA